MTDFLTTAEAAARLGVVPSRIRHLIAEGRLPARRHGRDWVLAAADVQAFRRQKRGPKKRVISAPCEAEHPDQATMGQIGC